MLVLSRRRNEQLIIETPTGERVTITVTDLRQISAKLGIDAPRSWRIIRKELEHGWLPPTEGHS